MANSVADIKQQIILLLGDLDSETGDRPATPQAGVLASNIDLLWNLNADRGAVWPPLQKLYTQRDCIDALIAVREEFTVKVGLGNNTVDTAGRMAALQAKRVAVQAAIDTEERRARSLSGAVSGELSTVEPVAPPPFGVILPTNPPDANDPAYSGSAYRRGRLASR